MSSGAEQADASVTCQALLDEGVRCLTEAGAEHARREAEWLLTDALGCSGRAVLYARPRRAVDPTAARTFRAHLRRRVAGEPLAYVLGHTDFFGLRLAVTPAVLIPRPETENVVEAALRRLADVRQPRVFDVGTGSGCIALAFKSERPGARAYACDVSREALSVARANAERLSLGVRFFRTDVLADAFPGESPAALDLLVSNPPYVTEAEKAGLPEAVRGHEPGAALFCGDDPLRFYRVLARHAARLLAPGGHVVLETHAHHAGAVAALLRESGLKGAATEEDAFGRERIATAQR